MNLEKYKEDTGRGFFHYYFTSKKTYISLIWIFILCISTTFFLVWFLNMGTDETSKGFRKTIWGFPIFMWLVFGPLYSLSEISMERDRKIKKNKVIDQIQNNEPIKIDWVSKSFREIIKKEFDPKETLKVKTRMGIATQQVKDIW